MKNLIKVKPLRNDIFIVTVQSSLALKIKIYFPKYIEDREGFMSRFTATLFNKLERPLPLRAVLNGTELWVIADHFDKSDTRRKAIELATIIYTTFKNLRNHEKIKQNCNRFNATGSSFFPPSKSSED